MSSNQPIFEAQHPVLSYTMKSVKMLFSSVLSSIVKRATQEISDYCAKEGTAAMKSLLFPHHNDESDLSMMGDSHPSLHGE